MTSKGCFDKAKHETSKRRFDRRKLLLQKWGNGAKKYNTILEFIRMDYDLYFERMAVNHDLTS